MTAIVLPIFYYTSSYFTQCNLHITANVLHISKQCKLQITALVLHIFYYTLSYFTQCNLHITANVLHTFKQCKSQMTAIVLPIFYYTSSYFCIFNTYYCTYCNLLYHSILMVIVHIALFLNTGKNKCTWGSSSVLVCWPLSCAFIRYQSKYHYCVQYFPYQRCTNFYLL